MYVSTNRRLSHISSSILVKMTQEGRSRRPHGKYGLDPLFAVMMGEISKREGKVTLSPTHKTVSEQKDDAAKSVIAKYTKKNEEVVFYKEPEQDKPVLHETAEKESEGTVVVESSEDELEKEDGHLFKTTGKKGKRKTTWQ